MTDDVRGLRAIPSGLLIGLALDGACAMGRLALGDAWTNRHLSLLVIGTAFASCALEIQGAFEAASRTTGRARIGFQLAAAGFIGVLMYIAAFRLAVTLLSGDAAVAIAVDTCVSYLGWIAIVVVVAGLAVAAPRRYLAAAIIGAAVITALWSPWLLAAIGNHFASDMSILMRGIGGLEVVQTSVIFGLVAAAARGAAIPDPTRARHGLSGAASGLRLRVIASLCIVGVMAFRLGREALGHGDGNSVLLYSIELGAAALNVAGLGWFGLGLLGAARASLCELGRRRLAIAAAATLWSGGVLLAQLLDVVKSPDAGNVLDVSLTPSSIAVLVSVVLVLAVLRGLAERRGLAELSRSVLARGAWVVVLLVAAAALGAWIRDGDDAGWAPFILVLAMILVIAMNLLARLCRAGAQSIEPGTALPTATIVSAT